MPRVHPRAEVDPGAKLAQSAAVGAFAVVGPEVELADDVWIGPHAYLTGRTTVGPGTSIFSFAVVGEDPQDKSFTGETSELLIGAGNVIREHCSIHTGTRKGGRVTRIGDDNLFMNSVHVGHDAEIGSHCILATFCAVAGHVVVEDYAVLGGYTGVHQYARVGESAMLAAGSKCTQDVPPFALVRGDRARLAGLNVIMPCDVTDSASLDTVFNTIRDEWGRLDFVVHAVAYSDKEQLKGLYLDTTLDNFTTTMAVSCYSFTAVCQRAAPLMADGGSLLTLTYYGAERVMPHYNVMGVAKSALEASVRYLAVDLGGRGIRVNAISAGPIKTLAASGIGDFRYILKWNEYNSPLKRNVRIDEVGAAAVYLLSDLSTAVTGNIHHVDCGYHVVGMKAVDAPDISVV